LPGRRDGLQVSGLDPEVTGDGFGRGVHLDQAGNLAGVLAGVDPGDQAAERVPGQAERALSARLDDDAVQLGEVAVEGRCGPSSLPSSPARS
jgi:hypothetical protein